MDIYSSTGELISRAGEITPYDPDALAKQKAESIDAATKKLAKMSYKQVAALSCCDAERLCDDLFLSTTGWDNQLRNRLRDYKRNNSKTQCPTPASKQTKCIVHVCAHCEAIYRDEPVSECDCTMGKENQSFIKGYAVYTLPAK